MSARSPLITALIFAICPMFGKGQFVILGRVSSIDSNIQTPFVSIGLKKQNIGSTSDAKGYYQITSYNKNDSIIFSSVGYYTSVISIDSILKNSRVYLQVKDIALKSVIINSSNKYAIANEFNNCSTNYYITSYNAVQQVAQLYSAPQKSTFLKKITICNQPVKSRFRVRIYDIDTSLMKPTTDLIDSIIEINEKDKKIEIVFENSIQIPQKYFFIAVEWLFIPENAFFTTMKLNSIKYKIRSYYPALSYKEIEQSNKFYEEPYRIWTLNYDGQWHPITKSHSKMNFLISATLLY